MPPQVEFALHEEEQEENPQQQPEENVPQRNYQDSYYQNRLNKLESDVKQLRIGLIDLKKQMDQQTETHEMHMKLSREKFNILATRYKSDKEHWEEEKERLHAQLKQNRQNSPRVPLWLHRKIMEERARKLQSSSDNASQDSNDSETPEASAPKKIDERLEKMQKTLESIFNDKQCSSMNRDYYIHLLMHMVDKTYQSMVSDFSRPRGIFELTKELNRIRASTSNPRLMLAEETIKNWTKDDRPSGSSSLIFLKPLNNLSAFYSNGKINNLDKPTSKETQTEENEEDIDPNLDIYEREKLKAKREIAKCKKAIYDASMEMKRKLQFCTNEDARRKIKADYDKAMDANIAALGDITKKYEADCQDFKYNLKPPTSIKRTVEGKAEEKIPEEENLLDPITQSQLKMLQKYGVSVIQKKIESLNINEEASGVKAKRPRQVD